MVILSGADPGLGGAGPAGPSRAVDVSLGILGRVVEDDVRQVRDVKEEELYFGELPLMTDTGTFIINGTERVIVYTAAFALRGDFHLGAEQRVHDMFDTMKGDFQAMTDVTFFPLVETQVSLPRQSVLVLIDTTAIQIYHPEIAS